MNHGPGSSNGILDWYTVLCGVIALVTLTAHGSLYVATKTEDDVNRRARTTAKWAWPLQLLLTVFGLIATVSIRPGVLDNYKQHAIGFVIPVLVFGSLAVMMHAMIKRADKIAFVASALYIVGMLVGAAFGLYPVVLPASTDPSLNLTILQYRSRPSWPQRWTHVVGSGDDPGSWLLLLPVPHVQRQGAAGRRRLLKYDQFALI